MFSYTPFELEGLPLTSLHSPNLPEIYRYFGSDMFIYSLLRQTAPTLMPIDHHFLFTTSRFLCRAQTSKSSRYIDPVDRKAGEIVERGITQEQFPPGDNQAELHFSIRPSYRPFIRSFVHVLGGGLELRKTRKLFLRTTSKADHKNKTAVYLTKVH